VIQQQRGQTDSRLLFFWVRLDKEIGTLFSSLFLYLYLNLDHNSIHPRRRPRRTTTTPATDYPLWFKLSTGKLARHFAPRSHVLL
jgi:hypothetical protein